MSHEIDFASILVPMYWAGQEKLLRDGRKVWACVACPDPDACAAAARCQRASNEDLARGLLAFTGIPASE